MITVSEIVPSKNATNVSINQDLKIRISADFKLDPRNISFSLNEVSIVPNVFSVYNGETDYELIVTLYTRQRIKYGEHYRYGEDGIRYGMRDEFPSMLNYGSRYICSFYVWGTNQSGQKEEHKDSFVFTTEDGIFNNLKPEQYFYSDFTQRMANKLPEWTKARSDKYSNFQQFLNPIGEILEKNNELIEKIFRSSALQTVDLKDIPFIHKYELDKNYVFNTIYNQDGNTFYVQPEVSGIQGITRFDLFTTSENNLKSFYYDSVPTRIDTEQSAVFQNEILGKTIASINPIIINKELERVGSICLYFENVDSSVYVDYGGKYTLLKCVITGKSIANKTQNEEIVIYNERYIYSKKIWKEIKSIKFLNLKNKQIPFRIFHFPVEPRKVTDSFKIYKPDGSEESAIWSIDNREVGTVLQKNITLGDTALDTLKFSGRTEVYSEMGLFDIDRETPLNLIDLTPDYTSNFLYGVDNDYLYMFDKREPYPSSLKKIPGDNGSADFVLNIESDKLYFENTFDKEISIRCSQVKPGKKILKYRIKVKKPDDTTEYILHDGSVTQNINNASIFVKQDIYVLEDILVYYNLTKPGEYIFELETMYQGGEASKDFAFINVIKKSAIAKYKLGRILTNSIPVSIFQDYDQNIKIYTNASILNNIIFRKDGIIIDYQAKTIYSIERYSSIDVE